MDELYYSSYEPEEWEELTEEQQKAYYLFTNLLANHILKEIN